MSLRSIRATLAEFIAVNTVIAGFDPAIHDELQHNRNCKAVARGAAAWMRGSSPRMTPGSRLV
jgi:hypothetical protein